MCITMLNRGDLSPRNFLFDNVYGIMKPINRNTIHILYVKLRSHHDGKVCVHVCGGGGDREI